LQVDIHQDGFLAKAKAGAAGIFLKLSENLSRGEVAGFHCRSCFAEEQSIMI
jgi:hypothetical protein